MGDAARCEQSQLGLWTRRHAPAEREAHMRKLTISSTLLALAVVLGSFLTELRPSAATGPEPSSISTFDLTLASSRIAIAGYADAH